MMNFHCKLNFIPHVPCSLFNGLSGLFRCLAIEYGLIIRCLGSYSVSVQLYQARNIKTLFYRRIKFRIYSALICQLWRLSQSAFHVVRKNTTIIYNSKFNSVVVRIIRLIAIRVLLMLLTLNH